MWCTLLVLTVVAFFIYGLQPFVFPGSPSPSFRVVTAKDAPILTSYIDHFAAELGDDKVSYLNHCLRTLSFAEEFLRRDGFSEEEVAARRKVMETALAFHDIALWSDGELNYLEPSAKQAELVATDLSEDEKSIVCDIIVYHHKFTAFHGGKDDAAVNAVRLVRPQQQPEFDRTHKCFDGWIGCWTSVVGRN